MTSDLPPSPPGVHPPHSPLDPVPVDPRPPRRGRAGRDLPAAIGVGVGLAAIILATVYTAKGAFVGLAVVAVVLALWELANAFGAARVRVPVVPVVAGGAAMLVAGYLGGADPLVAGLLLTCLAVLAWRLAEGPVGFVADLTASVFSVAYVPFLAGFAMLLLREPDGADRIVVFILLTACSDIGGYAAGATLGRHKLAPTISPKKSWEGLGGSVLLAAAGGALAVPLLLGGSPAAGVAVGLACVITATLGDLGESLIKRDIGIKDMSTLLPGHGGLMDRLDSLLPTAPVVYLLLTWLVPVG